MVSFGREYLVDFWSRLFFLLAGLLKYVCWVVMGENKILMGGMRIVKSGRPGPGYTLPCRASEIGLLGC